MTEKKKSSPPRTLAVVAPRGLQSDAEEVVRQIHSSPGKAVLERIMEHSHPRALVERLPSEDFFWLVKKIGEDDSIPLLAVASPDQWQYLLDLEVWEKDQPDIDYIGEWLQRLLHADSRRLIRWLFGEGEEFVSYYLSKNLEVVVKTEEEADDFTAGFFSLDGALFIRFTRGRHEEAIEELLRAMAEEDYPRYQNLLLGIAGVIAAETEEDLYRLRNVRLAEHGFLPFDEALAVYAPLSPDTTRTTEQSAALPGALEGREEPPVLPALIVSQTPPDTVLAKVMCGVRDRALADRLQLGFAVLCNRILAAEGVAVHDLEVLVRVCQRAASYLNLALETLCGDDLAGAEQLLRHNELVAVFRAGFGLALSLRKEAARWLKTSWFQAQGLDYFFWGEEWGACLTGLMRKRPVAFLGSRSGKGTYEDFSGRDELARCRALLQWIMEMDALVRAMAEALPLDAEVLKARSLSVQQVLLTCWAKAPKEGAPTFGALTLEEVREFFRRVRGKSLTPPFRMGGDKERFVRTVAHYLPEGKPSLALEEALGAIWKECEEEYAWVKIEDLDERMLRLFWVKSAEEISD